MSSINNLKELLEDLNFDVTNYLILYSNSLFIHLIFIQFLQFPLIFNSFMSCIHLLKTIII